LKKYARVEAILQTSLAILPSWTRQATLELEARRADLDLLQHAGCYASTGIPAYKRSTGRSSAVRPDGGVSARALNDQELATYRGCYADDVARIAELNAQLDEIARMNALVEHALGLVDLSMRLWIIKIYHAYPKPLPLTTLTLPCCRETFDAQLEQALHTMHTYLDKQVTTAAFYRISGIHPDVVKKKSKKSSKPEEMLAKCRFRW